MIFLGRLKIISILIAFVLMICISVISCGSPTKPTLKTVIPNEDSEITNVLKPHSKDIPNSIDYFQPIGEGKLLVADKQNIWKSVDSGKIWQIVLSGEESSYKSSAVNGFHFINKKVGFSVVKQKVYKTIDSGDTWNMIGEIDDEFIAKNCYFTSENKGWIVGSKWNEETTNSYFGSILFTQDGGRTWQNQESELLTKYGFSKSSKWMFRDVHFVNKSNGWIVGDNIILWTNNAGKSWKLSKIPSESLRFNKLYVLDDKNLWATVWQDSLIFRSSNGGLSWEKISSPQTFNTRSPSLLFITPLQGYALLAGLFKTDDGGTTWNEVKSNDNLKASQKLKFDFNNNVILIGQDEKTKEIFVKAKIVGEL